MQISGENFSGQRKRSFKRPRGKNACAWHVSEKNSKEARMAEAEEGGRVLGDGRKEWNQTGRVW